MPLLYSAIKAALNVWLTTPQLVLMYTFVCVLSQVTNHHVSENKHNKWLKNFDNRPHCSGEAFRMTSLSQSLHLTAFKLWKTTCTNRPLML